MRKPVIGCLIVATLAASACAQSRRSGVDERVAAAVADGRATHCIVSEISEPCSAETVYAKTVRRDDPYRNLVALDGPKVYSGSTDGLGYVAWLNWAKDAKSGVEVTSIVVETHSPAGSLRFAAAHLLGGKELPINLTGTPFVQCSFGSCSTTELTAVELPDDAMSITTGAPVISMQLSGPAYSMVVDFPASVLSGFLRRVDEERRNPKKPGPTP